MALRFFRPRDAWLLLFFAFHSLGLAKDERLTGPAGVTKPVSFAILEDYDKGTDLRQVALDFRLMNELGIDQMRCSFGWDDYEPMKGQYDFAWLKRFVELASQFGIKLRPYLAYTAPWAGIRGHDGVYWNDPPANLRDWYGFVYQLASALQPYPNVLSYEVYNEENDSICWEGGIAKYGQTLRQAALAVRAATPDAQVLVGGFVFPDYDWLYPLVDAGLSPYYDILPFHAYPETWDESAVETYLDEQTTITSYPRTRRRGISRSGSMKPVLLRPRVKPKRNRRTGSFVRPAPFSPTPVSRSWVTMRSRTCIRTLPRLVAKLTTTWA